MKIRPSILCACAVAVALLVLLIWNAKRPAKVPTEISTLPEQAEQAPNQPDQSKALPANTSGTTQVAVAPRSVNASPRSPVKGDPDKAREVLATLNDVPIVFYGKLEDQFGNPVSGAEVTGTTIIYNGQSAGTGQASAVSDANGFFTLDAGKGESLGVIPRKPGYAIASLNGGGIYSRLWSDEERQHPDPNNPVVIKMWKLQGAEPLVQINQRYKLHLADTPVNFDLLTGKTVPNGGDIKMTVSRSPGEVSEHNTQDWGVKIEVIEGGLFETSIGESRVTYQAPENGYQPSDAFIFSTNAPHKWSGGFDQMFFVQSRGGRVYSKLAFTFSINQQPDDYMWVELRGVANANGSRNWEGDPNTAKLVGQ
jgi:hypothetical protein